MLTILLSSILAGAVVAVLYFTLDIDTVVEASQVEKKEEFFAEPFEIMANLNLKETTRDFVKASVVISSTNEEFIEESKKYHYQMNDIIVSFINSKTLEDFRNFENREKLSEELVEKIEEKLNLDVENVYFTNLMLQ
ncbi:flagellar basal body-associated FliL family protein [Fredinandcohnia sp. QZ13]|uniref:flagellar basal body-associated FliL family protein n=1 Tax=Fredinandcohnia sp. QZ13 TaxID=3073144 RepID=UPI0028532550|nr:flagellar basal body-associated FliL family protein [Fredinandcohnia sp. QZ13]MDR4889922.1 flagellar basal body-associated FliL family protein [Fredinandcohnia sp. QZ13]